MQSETQWQQVMARDARQDGRFVFAVRTTGIYCRPSCPSRRPRRDSVEFFPDPQQAERAGYRACLRCKPTEISSQAQAVMRARQLLDEAEGVLTLAELSKRVGVSPFHLQRLFKRATGLSPREYQSARRMQQVKHGLRKGDDVTTALYDAGFGSPSRLYEKAGQQLGMTPGAYRRGGAGMTIQYAIVPSPLGRLLVAATARGLCAVRFGESASELERELREEFRAAEIHRDDAALQPYLQPLLASLRGENVTIDLPLDVRATAFQKKVWDALREIPAGETRSYSRSGPRDWRSQSGSRRCHGLRQQSRSARGAVPSRGAQRWRTGWISLGHRAQKEAAGAGTAQGRERSSAIMPRYKFLQSHCT